MFAFVMAAVAPTISHALRSPASDAWISQICTSDGARLTPADNATSDRSAPEPSQVHFLEHCPFCSLQAATAWLPSAPTVVVLLGLSAQAPSPVGLAGGSSQVWPAAQARAPPLTTSC